jgi:UDP-3-O-[3-hydroxymyristoyl] glucosamine N-acyltransferase
MPDPVKPDLPADDPLALLSKLRTKLNTLWCRHVYPFFSFGEGVSIHWSSDIYRKAAPLISFGDNVYVGPNVWLNLVELHPVDKPKLVLSSGCKIGRRSTISVRNEVILEEDVLLAPSVLIMDHNHEYSDPAIPIHAQGVDQGGTIKIEKNCWLGYGAVVLCSKGHLTIGRNSIVGANAVVTRSVAPFTVVAGNPARPVKQYDPGTRQWLKIAGLSSAAPLGVEK